jgi:hypothetical protein
VLAAPTPASFRPTSVLPLEFRGPTAGYRASLVASLGAFVLACRRGRGGSP